MIVKQIDLLDHALGLADAGWPVYPVTIGKTPLAGSRGFYDATRDHDRIREMFSKPGAHFIAAPTGEPIDMIVLDIDPEGFDWFARNRHRLPETMTDRTPRGGWHLFYMRPAQEIRSHSNKIAPGVDILGEFHGVILPPSPRYTNESAIDYAVDMPQWLIDECLRVAPVREPPIAQPLRDPTGRDYAVAEAALVYETEKVRNARAGEHHVIQRDAGLKLGNFVASGCLDWDLVAGELLGAAIQSGCEEGEARRTIEDGMGYGMQFPRYTPDDPVADTPVSELDFVSFHDLDQQVLPPLRVLIPDLLYEGLTVFAGPPKVGKSFLVLWLALIIARGGKMWDREVRQSSTALFALEDGPRRLQDRARQMLAGQPLPANAVFTLTAPTLDQGLVDKIRNRLESHPGTGLVTIDIFARVRGKIAKGETPYEHDARAYSGLQALAQAFHMAIIVVVHTTKGTSDDDVLKEVAGTNAVTGSADCIWIMTRLPQPDDAAPEAKVVRFRTVGRDSPVELDRTLQRDPETGRWEDLGEFHQSNTAEKREGLAEAILGVLANAGVLRPINIAEELGMADKLTNVNSCLGRLKAQGRVTQPAAGLWALPMRV